MAGNRWQVRATVAWQATTIAAVALVGGLPVALKIGDVVWREVANQLPLSDDGVVQ